MIIPFLIVCFLMQIGAIGFEQSVNLKIDEKDECFLFAENNKKICPPVRIDLNFKGGL